MAEVAALFAVGAQIPPPMGPVLGHLAAGSGLCVALAQRYANDPPDSEYGVAVRPARSLASTAEMRERLRAPDWAIDLATAFSGAYKYGDAAIRAYERAQAREGRGVEKLCSSDSRKHGSMQLSELSQSARSPTGPIVSRSSSRNYCRRISIASPGRQSTLPSCRRQHLPRCIVRVYR